MRSPRAPPREHSHERWRNCRTRRRRCRHDAVLRDAVEQEEHMLDQQQGAEREARDDRQASPLYRRPMPGGGYVEVELDILSVNALDASDRMLRGRIVMERRAEPSRRY